MKLGSPEHKIQFLQDLIKDYHENIWTGEIQALELEEQLGDKRKEKAALDLQLSEKAKPLANVEKKALATLEFDIGVLQDKLVQKRNGKEFWTKRIELINRYSN